MTGTYYNEYDPQMAAWLRELIADGLLPEGDVDERSIADVEPGDLVGYGACHFFAGIGGWPYALRLAGVSDDRPIWTGSCPCQPFSVAGKRGGTGDDRHLWPHFHRLIRECRPELVFGEQVDGAAGQLWLAGVHVDLEAAGYAVGAAVLPAAGVGAPHLRHRIYWMAHTDGGRREQRNAGIGRLPEPDQGSGVDNALGPRLEGYAGHGDDGGEPGWDDEDEGGSVATPGPSGLGEWADSDFIRCTDGKARRAPLEPALFPLAPRLQGRVGQLRGAGNAIVPPLAAEFIRAAIEVTP